MSTTLKYDSLQVLNYLSMILKNYDNYLNMIFKYDSMIPVLITEVWYLNTILLIITWVQYLTRILLPTTEYDT